MSGSIDKLLNDLKSAHSRGRFEPFIQHIRFPKFKNLARNSKLEFRFPITVIAGSNGASKSSILRALQACPMAYDLGNYWFENDIDRIDEESDKSDRTRYIHAYKVGEYTAECIKIRRYKEGRRSEYFETEKPRLADQMDRLPEKLTDEERKHASTTRWRPINKKVVYIDFRAELPAYDIYMNFTNRSCRQESHEAKKKFVKTRTKDLNSLFEGRCSVVTKSGKERTFGDVYEMPKEARESVSHILGKSFKAIKMIEHDLFGPKGWTVVMQSENLKYSEAFAGSGEFAVVMLVKRIWDADFSSLVLLDELETSLHPGAQKRFIEFLCQQTLRKKFQVVMVTHSPVIVEILPSEAIALISENEESAIRIESAPNHPLSVFKELGADFTKVTVYVEDRLAQFLCQKAAERAKLQDVFQFVVFPGGAQSIVKRNVNQFFDINQQLFILLDGDQRPPEPPLAVDGLSNSALKSELGRYNIKPQDIVQNGGQDVNLDAKKQVDLRNALEWLHEHIYYLPGEKPEDLVRSDAIQLFSKINALGDITEESDSKTFWDKLAEHVGIGSDTEGIFRCQKMAVEHAMSMDDSSLKNSLDELCGTLREMSEKVKSVQVD